MADYIEREKLLEDLERFAPECRAAFLIIRKQKATDAVPVVHGRWIPTYHTYYNRAGEYQIADEWHCSNCGIYSNDEWHYCPNCGASMDLKEESDD